MAISFFSQLILKKYFRHVEGNHVIKTLRRFIFPTGILVEHFSFLLCDLSRKSSLGWEEELLLLSWIPSRKPKEKPVWETPVNICRQKLLLLPFKETPCKVSNDLSFLLGQAALTQNSKGGTEHFRCLKASRAQSLPWPLQNLQSGQIVRSSQGKGSFKKWCFISGIISFAVTSLGRHTSVYLLRDITNTAFCLYAPLSSLSLLSKLKYVLVYTTISEY